ncbi:MAG TPA: hypothetical protein PKC62_07880 [Ferruginibacter sp.]|nr:hypothetical protein [Bacteroidota bacterium]MBS1926667.1 hypothetical protein [Bacteroidota bacterium]MCC6691896.1 hypothetical protein [Chitinophagaceae bacterium]HMT96593.1 hypothetical protein [Ferruginibacter sp.]HMU25002.1 hypothetical protein [Ferruginibacter sp.]
MKKIILSMVAFLMGASMVYAQVETMVSNDLKTAKNERKIYKEGEKRDKRELRILRGNNVSYQSRQQFLNDFNKSSILKSERNSNYDIFTFNNNGKLTKAYYDANAQLLGTTQIKTLADLPEKARMSLAKTYKGYKIMEVLYFNDNDQNDSNMWLYNTQFDDENAYFVSLQKTNKRIIIQVYPNGDIRYFAALK